MFSRLLFSDAIPDESRQQTEENFQFCNIRFIIYTSDRPHYENVPFEVPEGWVWCRLEDVTFDLKYGTSKKSLSQGKIAVLRMGNITNLGTIDYSNLVYSSNDEDISQYQLLKGDLVFNRTNSSEWVGKTAIYNYEIPAIYAGYLIRVRTIKLNPDFINFVMNSTYYRNWCYDVKTDAVNQSNINAQKLSQLMIPIPPLQEQRLIVAEIKKWIRIITLIENNKIDLKKIINQTKQKVLDLAIHGKLVPQDPKDEPAYLLLKRINPKAEIACDNGQYSKFPQNWAKIKIADVCDFMNGYAFNSDSYKQIGIPVVRISNIKDDKISLNECVYVDAISNCEFTISKGDLLIAMSGATTGKMGIYTCEEKAYLNQRVGNLRIKDANILCTNYRNYMMRFLQKEIIKKAYGGAQPNISSKMILNFEIFLPPLNEQKRIVQKIEDVFSILNLIQDSLEA